MRLPRNRIAQLLGMLTALIFLGFVVLVAKSYAIDYTNLIKEPNGGDILYKTQTYRIVWDNSLLPSFAQLELWLSIKDEKGAIYLINKIGDVASSDHFYNWTVPNWVPNGAMYAISARATNVPGVMDSSNYVFAILDQRQTSAFEFLTPGSNETWIPTSNRNIAWRSPIPQQRLLFRMLYKNSIVYERTFTGSEIFDQYTPANSEKNTNELVMHLSWPLANPPSGVYTIQVWIDDQTLLSRDVTITQPGITIVIPQANDRWTVGESHNISWQTNNVGAIGIRLLLDNQPYQTIVTDLNPRQGAYAWTIPSNIPSATSYSIQVYDMNSTITATSPLFAIKNEVVPTFTNNPPPFQENPSPLLLKTGLSPHVYAIIRSRKHWIPRIYIFEAYGYRWDNVRIIDEKELDYYPRAKLLQPFGGWRVYYITESGMKRLIPNPEVFTSYGDRWDDIIQVIPFELSAYPDSTLIHVDGDYRVYKLENGMKRWITTPEAFNRNGFSWSTITPVNQTELNTYPLGAPIE